jgi:NAD(P)-dependent dehydrogenase (short-subunit alcohol dehydrogenase family)
LPEARYRFTPLSLDLRDEGSIAAFASAVIALCASGERLVTLVHNAGIVAAGPVECVPLESLREVFEVNFFGVYSLSQKLVSTLIRDRGKIAIVGSLAGRIALPFFSPYVSSKFALEGFADSLRREMLPFGVRVSLFEPAAVATPIWNASWESIRSGCLPRIGRDIAPCSRGWPAASSRAETPECPLNGPRGKFSLAFPGNAPGEILVSKSVFVNKLEMALPDSVMDRLIALAFGTGRLADPAIQDGLAVPETQK